MLNSQAQYPQVQYPRVQYSQAQSPLADALASILRAQLRATSAALATSARGWSMWTQMLQAQPAIDEQPMARSQWPPSRIAWSAPWSTFGSTPWSISWLMNRPLSGLWEVGTCEVAQLGLVPFPPMWWAALARDLARGCWVPSADARAWKAGLVRPPIPALPPAVPMLPPAVLAGPRPDPSFASYRSAGGHALAQVIVKPSEELARATARAWLSPLEAMFGLWRAALGVSAPWTSWGR
jgi:hypothetical protein